MTEEQAVKHYNEEKEKLDVYDTKLRDLILQTQEPKLIDAFLDWQNQRTKTNEAYVQILSSILEE